MKRGSEYNYSCTNPFEQFLHIVVVKETQHSLPQQNQNFVKLTLYLLQVTT